MAELRIEAAAAHVERWTILGEARRNTLTRALVAELIREIERVSAPGAARAVVLTGEGEKAFCAGADLKERQGMDEGEVRRFLDDLRRMTRGIERSRAVFVAALEGSAYGGGTELSLACDLRLLRDGATLALTETTLAIIPGAGGTQRLPRLVGPGRAKELILTGRPLGAQEALAWGLVVRVTPAGQAVAQAVELAERIAKNGPVAVAAAKAAIEDWFGLALEAGLDVERREYEKTLGTKDRLEGLAAFKEKRPPVYRGE